MTTYKKEGKKAGGIIMCILLAIGIIMQVIGACTLWVYLDWYDVHLLYRIPVCLSAILPVTISAALIKEVVQQLRRGK